MLWVIKRIGPLVVGLSILFALCLPAMGMIIAQDGISQAVVVVAPGAPEAQRHAAKELAGYLQQITGATFAIVTGCGEMV